MGKGKTSKAALKKKERIELQKKMDSRIAIVKVANDQADPLDNLPSFRVKSLPFSCSIRLYFIYRELFLSHLERSYW